MAIAEPSPDMGTYEPTPEDTVSANADAPLDPELTPDNDPNVAEPDDVAVVTEGAPESEPTDMDGFTPGDRGTEDDLEADPIYLAIDPGAIEIEDPTPGVDDDAGEIYDASAPPPDDAAWGAVQDGTVTQVAMMAMSTPTDPLVIEPLSSPLEEVDDDRDAPAKYEIEGRSDGANWHNMATVPADELETEVRGLPTEENWVFRVRAIFANGEVGEWSAETAVELPKDMLAPPVPSTPSVTAQRGVFTLKWDGMGLGGAQQPPDYKFTIVWTSTSGEPGTWNAIGTMADAGEFMWSGGEYYAVTHFALSSLDQHGNSSERSASATAIMKPLVEEPDIQAELERIDAEHDGLVTEAYALDSRLTEARTELDATKAGLDKLQTVDLPAMDKRLSDADIAIRATQSELGTKLTSAETELAGHQARLGEAEASLTTLNGTTLPAMQSELDAAEASLGTLDTRLGAAESDLATASASLSSRLTTAESGLSTAQGEINKLETDVVLAAKTAAIESLYVTGTGTFSAAVIDKLWADVITARKIMADQVMIGSGSNLIVDPYFDNADIRQYRQSSAGLAGRYGTNTSLNLRWFGGTQSATGAFSFWFNSTPIRDTKDALFPVTDGDVYRFKGRVNAVGGKARWNAREYLKDGTWRFSAAGFGRAGYYHAASAGQWMEDTYTPSDMVAAFIPYITWEGSTTSAHVYAGASVTNMSDGNLIVAGSITGDHVEANSVAAKVATVIQLNANRINAGTVNTARLDTGAIAAATAAIQKADIKNLTVSSGTFSSAVIDKLWADAISARKITADQIYVGQGENLIPYDVTSGLPRAHDNFQQYGGGSASDPSRQMTGGAAGGNHLYSNATWVKSGVDTLTVRIGRAATGGINSGYGIPVEPGEELYGSMYVKAGGSYTTGYPKVRMGVYWYDASGGYIAGHIGPQVSLNWTWQKIDRSAVAPSTAAFALLYVRQDQPGGVRIDLPALYRKKAGNLIVTGSITGDHLEVNSVAAKVGQFIDLDVSQLKATSAKISDAVIDKLWADVIHAKKITADMMVITSGANLIIDPHFTDGELNKARQAYANSTGSTGWYWTGTYWYSKLNPPDGTNTFPLKNKPAGSIYDDTVVEPGVTYRIRWEGYLSGASAVTRAALRVKKQNGTTRYVGVQTTVSMSSGWKFYTNEWTPEADDVSFCPEVQFLSVVSASRLALRNVSITAMTSGELLVDGAVTATKVAANAITAGKIASNAVTTDKLNAGAVTAIKIQGRSITADRIAANAITAYEIASRTITAAKIASKSITANEISSYAITADKLHGSAITGKTITGGLITGSKYRFNGAGAGAGYDLRIDGDDLGSYLGWSVPGGTVQATMRAFDEDPWAEYSAPTLTLRPPGTAAMPYRAALKISAGASENNGLLDMTGNVWIRGQLRGRYQINNTTGGWTSLAINDISGSNDASAPSIKSLGMYRRTYTSSANVYVTSNGYLGRATSVRAEKLSIEDLPTEQLDALLNVPARWWFDRGQSEALAAYTEATEGLLPGVEPEDIEDVPSDLARIPGLVAEEVEEAGATAFVTHERDENGVRRLTGVAYDRVGAALLPIVKLQRDRIDAQDAKIADLEAKLAALTAKVDALIAA